MSNPCELHIVEDNHKINYCPVCLIDEITKLKTELVTTYQLLIGDEERLGRHNNIAYEERVYELLQ